jgi:DNA-binding transcriptional ArsR family regulator
VKSSIVSSETMNTKEIIEIGLGSIGKIKIIKALAEENKLTTIYMLHKKTHLKREDIKNNISDLVKIGWVNESRYVNVMYGINRENKYVSELMEFFNNVGYIGQP